LGLAKESAERSGWDRLAALIVVLTINKFRTIFDCVIWATAD
jgi:hypothetical protein